MAKVELKAPIVEEISKAVEGAATVVLVDHRGLTVDEDTRLRKALREAGVSYKVYKNTMMNFAFKDTDCQALCELLEGPNAIAVSKTDATAPARILNKFAKENPELELKAGIVEGTFYDAAGIKAIANVPSREELLSKLLGSIQSPIANFARRIKEEQHRNIWCYTGYRWEQVIQEPRFLPLLQQIDVLVEGPFILAQRNIQLRFRGSENQRIVDVPASLREGKLVDITNQF